MTLNLLLFAITFTIFLEIEFDFIFYVPYRSEEISPLVKNFRLKSDQDFAAKFDQDFEAEIRLRFWIWILIN